MIVVEFLLGLVLDQQMSENCSGTAQHGTSTVYNERRLAPMRWWRTMLCLLALSGSAPVAADGLLYQVLGGKGRAWLLGSLHFGKSEMYPLPQRIERAFAVSDRLMVEVNVLALEREVVAATIDELGLFPAAQSLREHLSEPHWRRLSSAAEQLNIPISAIERQRPWLASITLTAALVRSQGMLAREGVDQHFLRRARRLRMPVFELERFAQQMQLLSAVSSSEQVQMLESSLLEIESGGRLPADLLEAWRAADGARLERLVRAAFGRTAQAMRLATRLLDQRNGPMAQRIVEQVERGGTVFVVLGAAHLFGPAGVPEQLRQRGLKVLKR